MPISNESPITAVSRVLARETGVVPSNVLAMKLIDAVRETQTVERPTLTADEVRQVVRAAIGVELHLVNRIMLDDTLSIDAISTRVADKLAGRAVASADALAKAFVAGCMFVRSGIEAFVELDGEARYEAPSVRESEDAAAEYVQGVGAGRG